MNTTFIGIDEAGRWPWAWPLVTAGVKIIDINFLKNIPFLTDSKKLTAKMREVIYQILLDGKKSGKIDFCIIQKSASEIDTLGIREANRQAMRDIVFSLCDGDTSNIVLIDGVDNFVFDDDKISKNLLFEYVFAQKRKKNSSKSGVMHVPCESPRWARMGVGLTLGEDLVKNVRTWQKKNIVHFVIGGDGKYLPIASASILAKVYRDGLMIAFHKKFPEYHFDKNKWYGTKAHHEAILNYGTNFLHRKSYEPMKTLISSKKWL